MNLKQIFLFLLFSISLNGCQNFNVADTEHPEIIDRIIDTANKKMLIDLPLGIKYIDSAYNSFPQAGKYDKFRKYKLISEFYFYTYNEPSLAMKYVDSAINTLDKYVDNVDVHMSNGYNLKANIYIQGSEFENAIKYLFLIRTLNEKTDNFSQLGWVNTNIAGVYYKQKEYLNAIKYYQYANVYFLKMDDKVIGDVFIPAQRNLNNIALCYEKLEDLNKAEKAYQNALQYISKNEYKYPDKKGFIKMAKGVIYGNIGYTYFKKGLHKKAEQAYLKGIELNKEDIHDAIFTKLKLGNLYILLDRNDDVFKLLNETKIEKDNYTNKNAVVEKRWQELAYTYYEKTNNKPQAFTHFKVFHQIKDSLDLINNNLSNKDMNVEFIKLAQENEIEVLKRKDELKTVYLLLAVGLTLLSALSIFLLYRNARITKQNIKSLTILNAKISGHNQMMEKTLEALEQSQEENTHMMQVVAHDMRTPIAGVIGLTALMLEEDDLNEEQREILTMINTSGDDTLVFINDLLQAQHNKTKLIKEPVEMHTLLKYCITLLESKAKEKNQQLTIKTIPIEISISREKIWRVMSNLITNAIKFSPHNSSIAIAMEEKPLSILISVKDNGIGIPPELADKLFNMDAEVQREGTDGEKSFGLGLAISKQIIEAHNGNIWFESFAGAGTTFFVELPITES